jgi:hypothetical protein
LLPEIYFQPRVPLRFPGDTGINGRWRSLLFLPPGYNTPNRPEI